MKVVLKNVKEDSCLCSWSLLLLTVVEGELVATASDWIGVRG